MMLARRQPKAADAPPFPRSLRSSQSARQTSGARAKRGLRAGCEASETNLSKRSRAANINRGLEAMRARIMRKRASGVATNGHESSGRISEERLSLDVERGARNLAKIT